VAEMKAAIFNGQQDLHRRAILAIVLVSYTMIVLDISIVITALLLRGCLSPEVGKMWRDA
jgi:hypothetical protein